MSKSAGVLKEALSEAARLKAVKRAHDREVAIREWPGLDMATLARRLGRDVATIRGWVKEGKP